MMMYIYTNDMLTSVMNGLYMKNNEVYTYRKHKIDLLRIDRGPKVLVCS